MDIPIIREVINETSNLLGKISEDPNNVPDIISDRLLNNIYRLTYEVVLSSLKGVPIISSGTKALFSKALNEGIILREEDTRFSTMEHNIYKILYIIRIIDMESYSVLFKVM